MHRLWTCLLVLIIAAPLLLAADVSGKWAGEVSFKTPSGEHADGGSAACVLKQAGDQITGTAGPAEDQFPIRNGKIDGDVVTMEVVRTGDNGEMVYKVKLKVAGDKMDGTVAFTTPDGQKMDGTITLRREK